MSYCHIFYSCERQSLDAYPVVCMYTNVWTEVYTNVFTNVFTNVYTDVLLKKCTYVYIVVFKYVSTPVILQIWFTYACTCVYTYIHIYVNQKQQ